MTGNVLYSVSGSNRQSAAPTMDSDPSSSSGMALEYVACRHTSVAGSSGLFNDAELNGKDV